MGSVAAIALTAPALAAPDRYEQGSCVSASSAQCIQDQMLQDGNRVSDKGTNPSLNTAPGTVGTGAINNTSISGSSGDDDEVGEEIGEEANEVGSGIANTADEAGDEIGDAADEAGDAIGEAADEAGDAIDDAF
jgi:hypothetical protein